MRTLLESEHLSTLLKLPEEFESFLERGALRLKLCARPIGNGGCVLRMSRESFLPLVPLASTPEPEQRPRYSFETFDFGEISNDVGSDLMAWNVVHTWLRHRHAHLDKLRGCIAALEASVTAQLAATSSVTSVARVETADAGDEPLRSAMEHARRIRNVACQLKVACRTLHCSSAEAVALALEQHCTQPAVVDAAWRLGLRTTWAALLRTLAIVEREIQSATATPGRPSVLSLAEVSPWLTRHKCDAT